MTAQGKRSETSAALGNNANKRSSPERAAQPGLAMGFGDAPRLFRPFRAGIFSGRLTQGVAPSVPDWQTRFALGFHVVALSAPGSNGRLSITNVEEALMFIHSSII